MAVQYAGWKVVSLKLKHQSTVNNKCFEIIITMVMVTRNSVTHTHTPAVLNIVTCVFLSCQNSRTVSGERFTFTEVKSQRYKQRNAPFYNTHDCRNHPNHLCQGARTPTSITITPTLVLLLQTATPVFRVHPFASSKMNKLF